MIKLAKLTACCVTAVMLFNITAYAQVGDSSFFGGISEGRKLPKTTEILLQKSKNSKTNNNNSFVYKEVVFLSGKPVEVEGVLTIKSDNKMNSEFGKYKETHTFKPNNNGNREASIDRIIAFTVNYRKENDQIIKDYEVDNWNETITTPEAVFVLDKQRSKFSVSVIEDHTAGVVYYKGNISKYAVYGNSDNSTIHETMGSFYGYNNAWSSTETHRIDGTVTTNDWQMHYQVRPSVMLNKELQYDQNEPTAISFSGNYREVMRNSSGLKYDIFVKPLRFYDVENTGGANITTYNTFEQLIAPNVQFLKGHWAESDIRKLFSMQILAGNPSFYQPDQAITRGDFVTALVKAIKLPVEQVSTTRNARNAIINIVFPDVTQERETYPYIMAAYENGIAIGRYNGNFYHDSPIERQEVIAILLRAIGLENLGLDPTPVTSFVDDNEIGDWAKREIYAAQRIGLISPDESGRIYPRRLVSKAEAAAFINRLVDYMRIDLGRDYSEHIVNYSN